jgi:hypothetical protein
VRFDSAHTDPSAYELLNDSYLVSMCIDSGLGEVAICTNQFDGFNRPSPADIIEVNQYIKIQHSTIKINHLYNLHLMVRFLLR